MKQRIIRGRTQSNPKPDITEGPKSSIIQTTCIGCVYMQHPFVYPSGAIDIQLIYCELYEKPHNGKGCQEYQLPSSDEWQALDERHRIYAQRFIHASKYSRGRESGTDQINDLLREGTIPPSIAEYLLAPAPEADLEFREGDRRLGAGISREPGNCNLCAHCRSRTLSRDSSEREVVYCELFGDVNNQRCSGYDEV